MTQQRTNLLYLLISVTAVVANTVWAAHKEREAERYQQCDVQARQLGFGGGVWRDDKCIPMEERSAGD